jgi:FKBP-type peptidyl-prolyl cis-trans isomerase
MNDKKIYQIVGVVLVIVALSWLIFKKPASDSQQNTNQQPSGQEQQNTENNNQNNQTQKPTDSSTFWEGTLTLSDNLSKGNYALVTKDRKIYIKTSRDYSSLVGKEVKVTYEGTLEVFRLGDIVAK